VDPPLPQPPLAVRHLGKGTGALDDVPGFWNQVGVLYSQGHTDELAPDALLAVGAVPPLSATFRDLTPTRSVFPAFDPALCTGCARCWSSCPDGSIGAATVGPRALVEAGMARVTDQGGDAAGLRPVLGKVAKQLAKTVSSGPAGAQIVAAVDAVLARAGLPAERQAKVEQARDAVGAALADLPLSRTAPFYDQAPAGERELLVVAFDAETCKACRSCWAVCPTQAITSQPQDPARLAAARAAWRTWEQLPDTAGKTIARAAKRDDVDPVGALLMSRHALLAMTPPNRGRATAWRCDWSWAWPKLACSHSSRPW
ncbi:MAG: hypothetical protein GXP62_11935, partial [Oligoflexia bacterium]|nr:hypothetical protein [Oligoflexia bacterium]